MCYLNLRITSRKLSSKIKTYRSIFEENFIDVKYPQRKSNARLIQVKYDGYDDVTG